MVKINSFLKYLLLILSIGCCFELQAQSCEDYNFKLKTIKAEVCQDNVASFVVKGAPSGSQYEWRFANQLIQGKSDSVNFIATQTGLFDITVEIQLPNNKFCFVIDSGAVEVNGLPDTSNLSLESNAYIFCSLPANVKMKVNTNPDYDYTWILNSVDRTNVDRDYRLEEGNTLQTKLNQSGYKSLSLTVKTTNQCELTKTYDSILYVYDLPDLEIGVKNKSNTCDQKTVDVFAKGLTSNDLTYMWELNGSDIKTGTGERIEDVYYNQPGAYSLILKYTSKGGCLGQAQLDSAVVVGQVRNIELAFSKTQNCADKEGLNVRIKDPDALKGGIQWELPGAIVNDSKSNRIKKSLSYVKGGTYSIGVNYNEGGCKSSVLLEDTIKISKVSANFSSSLPCDCEPQTVDFTNTSTTTFSSDSLSYHWTITEIASNRTIYRSTDKDIQYPFRRMGVYRIALLSQNKNGCRNIKEQLIDFKPLKAQFEISSGPFRCLGQNLELKLKTDEICEFGLKKTEWNIYNEAGEKVYSADKESVKTPIYESGWYSVELILTNNSGCTDTVRKNKAIQYFQMEASVVQTQKHLCIGEEFEFKVQHAPFPLAGTNDIWYLHDSKTRKRYTGMGSRFKAEATHGGSFDLKMITRINDYCADTVELDTALKISGVEAEILSGLNEACIPFKDTASVRIKSNYHHYNPSDSLSYEWDCPQTTGIDIGEKDASQSIINIDQNGYYTLSVVIQNSVGCKQTFTSSNHYSAGVVSDFKIDPIFCKGVPYKLMNKSRVNANKFEWLNNRPNGISLLGSRTARNFSLQFDSSGEHQITLVAENKIGCIDSTQKNISVIDFAFDFSSSSIKEDILCSPISVEFETEAINVDTFIWDFGDGKRVSTTADYIRNVYDVLTAQNQNDEYTYDVKLVAASRYGCYDTLTKSSYIKVFGPKPKFLVEKTEGTGTLTTGFVNVSQDVNYYYFDHGDNKSLDSSSMRAYTYYAKDSLAAYSQYIPIMYAFDDRGCSRTVKGEPIRVYNQPEPDFVTADREACDSMEVQLINKTKFGVKYKWYLNDADTVFSTDTHPLIYLKEGRYSVKLVAFNDIGDSATLERKDYINVHGKANIDFHPLAEKVCPGREQMLIDSSKSEFALTDWHWKIGVAADTLFDIHRFKPEFNPSRQGAYFVEVTLTDRFGCSSTKTIDSLFEVSEPTQIVHEGLGFVSRTDDNRLRIYISDDDIEGTMGFLLYEQGVNTERIVRPDNANPNSYLQSGYFFIPYNSSDKSYQLKAINECWDTIETGLPHRPIDLEVMEEAVGYLPMINWTPYKGWAQVSHQLLWRKMDENDWTVLDSLPADQYYFLDSNVCNHRYEYYVEAIKASSSYSSLSNPEDANPDYRAPQKSVQLSLVTVTDGDEVYLQWEPHPHENIRSYVVSRIDTQFNRIDSLATVSGLSFTDTFVYSYRTTYAYRVVARDFCSNRSNKSAQLNTVVLQSISNGGDIDLYWNRNRGWDNATYTLEKRRESGNWETIYENPDSFYTDKNVFLDESEPFFYRVRLSLNGLVAYSNKVKILPEARVFIPNAFTPNQDGLNDEFTIAGTGVLDGQSDKFDFFDLRIFNRWGSKVYQSNSLENGWDGTFKGRKAESGSYRYQVEIRDHKGQVYYYQGKVSLLR